MAGERTAIPGSVVPRPPGQHPSRPADPQQMVEATIVLRRPAASQALGADPADLRQVVDFARSCHFHIAEESAAKRMVRIAGTVEQMNAAFGISLACFEGPGGGVHLSYEGPLTVPAAIAGAILAVLGLHQAPIARPH